MTEHSVLVSLSPGHEAPSRVLIASAIRHVCKSISMSDSLMIATNIKMGHYRFNTPLFWDFKFAAINGLLPVWLLVKFDEPVNEYQVFAKEREALYNLLKAGGAGDAEAAIAYCKAELAGEISHGAFA